MSKVIEFTPKAIGTAVGIASGFGSSLGPAGLVIAATVPKATLIPLLWGAVIGMVIFIAPTIMLQHRINEQFDIRHSPMTNRCCHFLLYAAFITLSTLVGFAIMSAFMSIIANPFTLPVLITGGISAAIMFGLYAKTSAPPLRRNSSAEKYVALPAGETPVEFASGISYTAAE